MSALLQFQMWLQSRLQHDDSERGASLVEYALLVSLIAIVCLLAILFLGEEASSSFTDSGSSVANAT